MIEIGQTCWVILLVIWVIFWSFSVIGSRLPREGRNECPPLKKNVSKFSYTRELTGSRNWSDMLGHFF